MTEVARPDALARLRAAAADRPRHALYLETLVEWWENGADEEHEPSWPPGVSGHAADLWGDVAFCFNPSPNVGGQLDYPERRRRAKLGAAQAQRTKRAGGIEKLLP